MHIIIGFLGPIVGVGRALVAPEGRKHTLPISGDEIWSTKGAGLVRLAGRRSSEVLQGNKVDGQCAGGNHPCFRAGCDRWVRMSGFHEVGYTSIACSARKVRHTSTSSSKEYV